MGHFNADKVMAVIRGGLDFGNYAGEYLVDELYAELCGHYLSSGGSRQERIEVYAKLYDSLFRLTLRMNRLCPVYDEGFIAHIAREAIAHDGGAWEGIMERELCDAIRRRIQRINHNGGFAVDCHVHTSDGSGCARDNTRQMVESAIANGLNGIIITEHDRLTPQARIDEFNAAYAPFRVFSGIEIRIQGDDFLVLGLHDDILEQKKWEYTELFRFVRERGGYLALAHPMRYWNGVDANVYSFKPDALELYSVNLDNISWQARQNALRLANTLQARIIANSDAHATDAFRYCNVLEREPQDESELIQLLKEGAYRLGRVPV
jgi:histidinol phosphatase-like PHP family hydrolase